MEIKDLGMTKKELQDRIIERVTDRILHEVRFDDADGEFTDNSKFKKSLIELVQKRIDKQIEAMAEKHVLPNAKKFIEELTLQETTKWGEKRGTSLTFIEYLVARAENYLREQVSFEGKSRDEANGYSWTGTQTRLTHLIHQHLHYAITKAMAEAIKNGNSVLVKGLEDTCKLKLAEIAATLKVTTNIKEH